MKNLLQGPAGKNGNLGLGSLHSQKWGAGYQWKPQSDPCELMDLPTVQGALKSWKVPRDGIVVREPRNGELPRKLPGGLYKEDTSEELGAASLSVSKKEIELESGTVLTKSTICITWNTLQKRFRDAYVPIPLDKAACSKEFGSISVRALLKKKCLAVFKKTTTPGYIKCVLGAAGEPYLGIRNDGKLKEPAFLKCSAFMCNTATILKHGYARLRKKNLYQCKINKKIYRNRCFTQKDYNGEVMEDIMSRCREAYKSQTKCCVRKTAAPPKQKGKKRKVVINRKQR